MRNQFAFFPSITRRERLANRLSAWLRVLVPSAALAAALLLIGPRETPRILLSLDGTTVSPEQPVLIDVNLARQEVTPLEGGQVVLTTLTSTGVRGVETPVETFMVQYKIPSTRMRGVTPSGSRYDIPDVPWVLALRDDFTIHGAYWRNGFGFPQSNGYVSLPTPIAERGYRWASIGTPIVIHY